MFSEITQNVLLRSERCNGISCVMSNLFWDNFGNENHDLFFGVITVLEMLWIQTPKFDVIGRVKLTSQQVSIASRYDGNRMPNILGEVVEFPEWQVAEINKILQENNLKLINA